MGGHHAACGAATAVAVSGTSALSLAIIPAPGFPDLLARTMLCAGAALLPDIDHHDATIAHALPDVGPIPSPTHALARAIGTTSGGHRHGTHSLLAVIVFTLAAAGLGFIQVPSPEFAVPYIGHTLMLGAGILTVFLLAFALKALKLSGPNWTRPWLVGIVGAVFMAMFLPESWQIVPLMVGIGVVIHLAGDFLTTGGLPLLWPWIPKPPKTWANKPVLDSIWQQNGHIALPVLGNAGSMREWALCGAISLYTMAGIVAATGFDVTGFVSTIASQALHQART